MEKKSYRLEVSSSSVSPWAASGSTISSLRVRSIGEPSSHTLPHSWCPVSILLRGSFWADISSNTSWTWTARRAQNSIRRCHPSSELLPRRKSPRSIQAIQDLLSGLLCWCEHKTDSLLPSTKKERAQKSSLLSIFSSLSDLSTPHLQPDNLQDRILEGDIGASSRSVCQPAVRRPRGSETICRLPARRTRAREEPYIDRRPLHTP